MDIDIWILVSSENIRAVLGALKLFGAPTADITEKDFNGKNFIFQIGVAPRRIDLLTAADGLDFEEAYKNAREVNFDGIIIKVLSKSDLIKNKRASGRTKDLADIEELESR